MWPLLFLLNFLSQFWHILFFSPLPPLIIRHYPSLKNISHVVCGDFACLFTQVFIKHLLYKRFSKNMHYAKGAKIMNQSKAALMKLTLRTLWIWDTCLLVQIRCEWNRCTIVILPSTVRYVQCRNMTESGPSAKAWEQSKLSESQSIPHCIERTREWHLFSYFNLTEI